MATLKELRERRNLSLYLAAKRLGVTTETVRNWEKGEHTPREDSLVKMVQVYDCPIQMLLDAVGR